MRYKLAQWPRNVYQKEVKEIAHARIAIDVALSSLTKYGPSPEGYNFMPLGKAKNGLWQLNVRIPNGQVRILYCPYGDVIVVFRIHKKSSSQEQEKAYAVAIQRKKEYERLLKEGRGLNYVSLTTIH